LGATQTIDNFVHLGLRGSNDILVGQKMEKRLLFSVQGSVGVPTGPDQDNRLFGQDCGSQGWPASSGVHCQVRRFIIVKEQDQIGEFPVVFFF
jgi:hypothetical protein